MYCTRTYATCRSRAAKKKKKKKKRRANNSVGELLCFRRALACCFSFFSFGGNIVLFQLAHQLLSIRRDTKEGHRNLLTLPTPPVTINLLLNSLAVSHPIFFLFPFHSLFSKTHQRCFALPTHIIWFLLVFHLLFRSILYSISSIFYRPPSHNFNHVDWMIRRKQK